MYFRFVIHRRALSLPIGKQFDSSLTATQGEPIQSLMNGLPAPKVPMKRRLPQAVEQLLGSEETAAAPSPFRLLGSSDLRRVGGGEYRRRRPAQSLRAAISPRSRGRLRPGVTIDLRLPRAVSFGESTAPSCRVPPRTRVQLSRRLNLVWVGAICLRSRNHLRLVVGLNDADAH